jgi:hypothetical protein
MTDLEEIAVAAEEVADQQKQVARQARSIQRLRDRGWSWADIMDRPDARRVLSLLRASRQRLVQATSRFTRGLTLGLRAEGESHRKIAERIGVSHQRVSAMLGPHEQPLGAGE